MVVVVVDVVIFFPSFLFFVVVTIIIFINAFMFFVKMRTSAAPRQVSVKMVVV